jgi:hypothetical protein
MNALHSTVVRYDTRGVVFDGRYVYLVPADYSLVERFDARTPPLLPPGSTASFF